MGGTSKLLRTVPSRVTALTRPCARAGEGYGIARATREAARGASEGGVREGYGHLPSAAGYSPIERARCETLARVRPRAYHVPVSTLSELGSRKTNCVRTSGLVSLSSSPRSSPSIRRQAPSCPHLPPAPSDSFRTPLSLSRSPSSFSCWYLPRPPIQASRWAVRATCCGPYYLRR